MYYINLFREFIHIQPWFPFAFLTAAMLFFLIFWYWRIHEPRSMKNGMFFNLGLLSLMGAILTFSKRDPNDIWAILSKTSLFIFVVVIIFAVYAGIVLLIWNARILVRPGEFTTANVIVISLALAFMIYLIAFGLGSTVPGWLGIILTIIPLFIGYFGFVFADFLVTSVLDNFYRPTLDYDYIIVLGAGLIRGNQISGTLGSRLRKSFEVANKQFQTTHIFPVIIVSGGKGDDETISEAAAMRQWMIDEGYPKEYIQIEDQSRNTFQNMQFSKKLIDQNDLIDPKIVYVSNSYHIVRAGTYARNAGLEARGIGSRTPGFFVPSGWLREFAAIVVMKRKQHIQVFLILLLLVLAGAIVYQVKMS
jgi:uncharacterized SAM-binding protein YcdF (DUF218 family)